MTTCYDGLSLVPEEYGQLRMPCVLCFDMTVVVSTVIQ